MATSAFKSTTRSRRPANSPTSNCASTRRSRSLSRFTPHPEIDAEYNSNVPRGKFVNTTRGSGSPFPEISLDDLALEFFSSSSNNGNESDGVVDRKERPGRAASRLGEVGRWAADTASSRRRARSVSRSRGGVVGSSSGNAAGGGKHAISNGAGSRRRRSQSVARHQISDSESEVDNFRNSRKHDTGKTCTSWNSQNSLGQMTTASTNGRLGRSRSHKNVSKLHDGYFSQTSALTDDDSKGSQFGINGFEKIIRAVVAQKKSEHPTAEVANGSGLYAAMRKEIRCAVEEICTELNQTMEMKKPDMGSHGHLQSENSETLQESSVKEKYAPKLEQLEKCKQDFFTEMLLEEQGQEVPKLWEELPDPRILVAADKPSRTRKGSSERIRISENLIEEAEHIFEDFINNIEDADVSSFDGERSDWSSAFGGTVETRDYATSDQKETHVTPIEMDGVILPWLQWETNHDSSLSGRTQKQTPVTPKALQWDLEQDMYPCNDQSKYSGSSHGSWSPDIFQNPCIDTREEDAHKMSQVSEAHVSRFDMDEYLKLRNDEDLLFEMYRERGRMNSGGVLLCGGVLY